MPGRWNENCQVFPVNHSVALASSLRWSKAVHSPSPGLTAVCRPIIGPLQLRGHRNNVLTPLMKIAGRLQQRVTVSHCLSDVLRFSPAFPPPNSTYNPPPQVFTFWLSAGVWHLPGCRVSKFLTADNAVSVT
jgi:hypothetical protein